MQPLCGIKRPIDALNLDASVPKIRRINSSQTEKTFSFSFQAQFPPSQFLNHSESAETIEALFYKATDLQKCQRFQSAILAYRLVLEQNSNHLGALNGLKKAINQHVRRLHLKTDQLISEKEWTAAKLKSQKILSHYPKSKAALKKYRNCHIQQQVEKSWRLAKQAQINNQWKTALFYYDLCLSHTSQFIACLEKKAYCLKKLKRIKEAFSCYQQILKIEPQHTVALKKQTKYLNFLSLELSAYKLMNDWQSIEKTCREILMIRPEAPNILWKWVEAKKWL